jgi:hypothetical protein
VGLPPDLIEENRRGASESLDLSRPQRAEDRSDRRMARKDPDRPQDGLVKHSSRRALDARSLEQIGASLKAHYENLVQTPVPEKFLELLDRLEAKEHDSDFGGASDKPE